jgi:hypothetical protein
MMIRPDPPAGARACDNRAYSPSSRETSMTLKNGHEIQQIIYDGGLRVTVQVIDESTKRRNSWGDPEWLSVPLASMPNEWLREVRGAVDNALRVAA